MNALPTLDELKEFLKPRSLPATVDLMMKNRTRYQLKVPNVLVGKPRPVLR